MNGADLKARLLMHAAAIALDVNRYVRARVDEAEARLRGAAPAAPKRATKKRVAAPKKRRPAPKKR
jgi:hypothetical protein